MAQSVESVPKRVILAAPRGYCAGVDRAVQTVEEALDDLLANVDRSAVLVQ